MRGSDHRRRKDHAKVGKMRREDWTVTEKSVAPAGRSDECFWCKSKLGSQHKYECVIRKKTVIVSAAIEYLVSEPESWDTDMIEFHRNESSWCQSNGIDEIQEAAEKYAAAHGCQCSMIEYKFAREATTEDEERFSSFKVTESES